MEQKWKNVKRNNYSNSKRGDRNKGSYGRKKNKVVWWTEVMREAKIILFLVNGMRKNPKGIIEYETARNKVGRVKLRVQKETWERLGNELKDGRPDTQKAIYNIAKNFKQKYENEVNTIKKK